MWGNFWFKFAHGSSYHTRYFKGWYGSWVCHMLIFYSCTNNCTTISHPPWEFAPCQCYSLAYRRSWLGRSLSLIESEEAIVLLRKLIPVSIPASPTGFKHTVGGHNCSNKASLPYKVNNEKQIHKQQCVYPWLMENLERNDVVLLERHSVGAATEVDRSMKMNESILGCPGSLVHGLCSPCTKAKSSVVAMDTSVVDSLFFIWIPISFHKAFASLPGVHIKTTKKTTHSINKTGLVSTIHNKKNTSY